MSNPRITQYRIAYTCHVLRMLRAGIEPLSFNRFTRTAALLRLVYGE